LVGVGPLRRTTLLLFFAWRRWWPFFVTNRADTKLVFGEDRRIQWNFSPVGKSIAAFNADARCAATAVKSFRARFCGDAKAIGQSHFNFLSEQVIRRSVAKHVAFINFAEIKCPWWQDISGRGRSKTRP